MIFQYVLDGLIELIIWLVSLIPVAGSCVLDGVDSAVSWFGYIYSASQYIIPWSDLFFMLGITLTIASGQIFVQIIKTIRG